MISHFKQGKDNWGFIVSSGSEAVAIDPLVSELYLDYLDAKNLKLVGILLTHYHWDHVKGVPQLLNGKDIPVIGPNDGGKTPNFVTNKINDSEGVQLGTFNFTTKAVPGHTTAMTTFGFEEAFFVGDLLFNLGCGRILEGTHEQMFESLQWLKGLPKNSKLYVGHDYRKTNLAFAKSFDPDFYKNTPFDDLKEVPTLGTELHSNPFLRAKTFEEWKKVRNLRDVF